MPESRTSVRSARPTPAWVIMVVGIALPAVLIVALGSLLLWNGRQEHQHRAESLAQNLAAALARSTTADIEKIDVALQSIVGSLEAQLGLGGIDARLTQRQIETQAALRPELDGFRVTDARGIAFLGQQIVGKPPVDFSDREWFVAQRDRADAGLFMSRPLKSRITGQWIVSFSRRYRDAQGHFAGAVSAAVPMVEFGKALTALEVGGKGVVTLRRKDLHLIARHPAAARAPGGAAPGPGEVTPRVATWMASASAQATIGPEAGTDGVERIAALRRLSIVPMVVSVSLAGDDYLATWRAQARMIALAGAGAAALFALGTMMLVRARTQNQRSRQRVDLLAKVFEHSGEAVAVMDRRNRIVEVNPAFVRRTGYAPADVIGTRGTAMMSEQTPAATFEAIRAALRTEGCWRGELLERAKDGREIPVWMVFSTVTDDHGRIDHVIANSIDLTELKRAEAQIRHLAHHDTLTRLPNRALLQARLDQSLADARRRGEQLAMLFIDMDHFKTINDTLGHEVGDGLLVEVARRLKAAVRESDIVARQGGDEFVVVLTGVGHAGASAATTVARKLLAELGRPYQVGRHELHSTPSMGIGIFPSDAEDAGALMKCADTAMYHAKAAGRNTFQFFTPDMKQASAERLSIESGLRHAVARQELRVVYQPQHELGTGRVVGVEALVRWQHPELGVVPPLKFIGVAEETGQIEQVGQWVLEQALAQVARWRAELAPDLRVAVNVSARQLRGDLVAVVADALQRHGLPGQALELEVTESVAMHDPERIAGQLRSLRALGVAFAVDDFGTGYSSMGHLKALPLDRLKLDRSFVTDMERDPNDAAICRATIQLAHGLGLSVVAEGVETRAQYDHLRGLGCDVAQGYLIARPMAGPECEAYLAAARAPAAQARSDRTMPASVERASM